MRSIAITRIHTSPFRRWKGFRRLQLKGYSWKGLLLLWGILSVAFAFLPEAWAAYRVKRAWNAWASSAHQTAHFIGRRWVRSLEPPAFATGDEAALTAQLAADPLVRALVDPGRGQAWVRDGDRLRPAAPGADTDQMRAWAREAAASGVTPWRPGPDPRGPLQESILVLPAGRWFAIKRWRPESPEVERFLQGVLGNHARVRFGLVDSGEHLLQNRDAPDAAGSHLLQTGFTPRASPQPLPPWSLQVPLTAGLGRGSGYYCLKSDFGWGWMGLSLMSPREEEAQRNLLLLHRGLGWLAYALWIVATLAGLLAYRHAAHRERLEADRLASLTHSLKTPLALLKLRCDTVRITEVTREAQEATLLQIGEEVDQLVRLIECGLEGSRPARPSSGRDTLTPAFFEEVKEELEATFAEDGRSLRVTVDAGPFRAPALALKSALATLLENALLHGRGAVALEVRRERRRVAIEVTDEGEGLSAGMLEALRERKAQAPSPDRKGRGQGLGLLLLTRMAEREGWGFRFRFRDGGGFSALLELPV
ncbi:sensor histidine kinase [Mesoterricola silvestris]|uniref:histidine kinase n=1 Tax=Mesoterricola silvestris TaxID=2927979 RepID=A0AA48GSB3_9BACT|nr:ATP-binding protein [Mesoterricola silvestris]BDU74770.1 hypothetical protein METEAL_39440 [Mesoterricola silvestris]